MNSGIYQIRNLIDNKIYVGSAVDFNNRKKRHLLNLRKQTHHSILLQRAYNKYGSENFVFEVLKECEREFLYTEEQKYLDDLRPYAPKGYNISELACGCSLPGSKNPMYGKKGLDNPNFGSKRTQEQKETLSRALKGIKRSEEMRSKMSAIAKTRIGAKNPVYGKKKSAQQKQHLSKIRSQKVVQYDKDSKKIIKIWDSAKIAGSVLGIDASSIARCCRSKVKTAGKFVWRKYLSL